MKRFKEYGLSDKLLKNLEEIGITEPTKIQKDAIPLTFKGKDVIGGSATGSGKTLAFSASMIEKIQDRNEIQALIMTPTRELAEQVSDSLKKFSKNFPIRVLPVYGGVSIEKQIKNIPRSNVIVGTPGRILDHLNRKTLDLSEINYLVLDEVDRMFEMGFQEDVEKIISHCSSERQTLMFSATISSELDYLSKKHSKNPEEVLVDSQVDPSKLKQVFYDVSPREKFSLLVHLLKNEKSEVVMVFCNTRRNSDFVAENLSLNGINAQAIHGGLTQSKRQNVLGKFHKGTVNVLVCTDVAARGLDIKNVSHVYNYDIPGNLTEYTHRIGRTARAGEEGKVINVVSSRDYIAFSDIEGAKNMNVEKVENPKEIPRAKMNVPNKSGRRDDKRGFNKGNNRRSGRDNRNGGGRRDDKRNNNKRGNDRTRGRGFNKNKRNDDRNRRRDNKRNDRRGNSNFRKGGRRDNSQRR